MRQLLPVACSTVEQLQPRSRNSPSEVIDEILVAHGEKTGDYRARRSRKGQGAKNVIVPLNQCLSAAVFGEASSPAT